MIKKAYLKTKKLCKVTFALQKEDDTETLELLGDFNSWSVGEGLKLKKQKNNTFKGTLNLEIGKEYEFRYLINGTNWGNDNDADKQVPNPYGSQNSVLSI